MFRAFTNFLLFSSVYVSLCAILLIWQTNTLLNLHPVNIDYYKFAFFSTICSYNFHWYLTPAEYSSSPRLQWGVRHKNLQLVFAIIGGIGAAICFWDLKAYWLELSGAAFLTFLYSAPKIPIPPFTWLRKIAIGKTIFLTSVWVYVTNVLPIFLSGAHFTTQAVLYIVHRFFIIYALCILFDYRDVESDKREGIRSLITWLSKPALMRLYFFSLLISALFAFLVCRDIITFYLLTPIVITALLTKYTLNTRSDYYYYFVLDGLVMLSAVLHYIAVVA
ncbi:UbiA family prenyltransferase [Chitinophaga sancti]|uniref:UbiA family prenyltransferase n=1 Tax=Chitinophaga sancti TaxID=1004 RepID=UPI002A75715B|nr:UbiA family prenyltransferase [Chitinophaga sancti]WPQ65709.1 UbiA family prenyltransferase [Chitinophaga sancti]